jgi:hypothetical protein
MFSTIAKASGNRPFELAAFIICGLLGAFYWLQLFTGFATRPPNSVDHVMPPIIQYIWYGLLFCGGVVGVVGMFWRPHIVGLLIERSSLIAISAACLMYAVSLFAFSGLGALGSGAFLGALGLACVARYLYIPTEVRQQQVIDEVVHRMETSDE